MARILALDWDRNQVHVVAGHVGRGKARLSQAAQLEFDADLTPQSAEDAGRRLRERLKAAGIAPAPLLACIGRDRVILKDIRHPAVPPAEEPALVRFQASKDLTDNPDDAVIDYVPRAEPGPMGERRALAVIVRRELIETYHALCRGLGVKLLGVTPRPFGIAAALERVSGAEAVTTAPGALPAVSAVLALGAKSAEFCIVRDGTLLFARSIAVGHLLVGEVRRSLAVYAGGLQAVDVPHSLYVAGNGEHTGVQEELRNILAIPVHGLDPFAREDRIDVSARGRGGFCGAAGLLHLAALRDELPINLAKPKEPKPVVNLKRRRLVIAAAAAAVALILIVASGSFLLAGAKAELKQQNDLKAEYDAQLKNWDNDAKDIALMKEWELSSVSVIDELYDLTARMPHEVGLRVTSIKMDLTPKKVEKGKEVKDAPIAKLVVTGLVPKENTALVNILIEQMNRDGHLQAKPGPQKTIGPNVEWTVNVDVGRQAAQQYTARFDPPPAAAPRGNPLGGKKGGPPFGDGKKSKKGRP